MRASDVAGFETRDSEFGTSNPMPSRPNIKGEYEPKKAAAKAPSSKAAPLSTRGPCLAVALVLLVVVGAAGAAGWYFFLRGGGGGAGDDDGSARTFEVRGSWSLAGMTAATAATHEPVFVAALAGVAAVDEADVAVSF